MAHNFVPLIVASIQIVAIQSVQFIIRNNVSSPIDVGILGNLDHENLNNGGFHLNVGQEMTINAPDNWAGTFWPKTLCFDGSCETGDCGRKVECAGNGGLPPITSVEITLRGSSDNQDFYYVSVDDGFNVFAAISPVDGIGNCSTVSCACDTKMNEDCPAFLAENENDLVIGCHSSCVKFNSDEYCCRGSFIDPNVCKPENMPEENSANYFKSNCPQYFSYAYDYSSIFTCLASTYIITFC